VSPVARSVTLASVLVALAAGCVPEGGHALRFDLVQEPVGDVVTESKSYWFWGLVPTREVDVLDKCPYGAVAIRERTGGSSVVLNILTLGLLSARSTTYECRAPRVAGS
jgi:hypothetical protein